MSETSSEATRILDAINKGDSRAADLLLPLVYDELKAIAVRRMRQERHDHTLQPTALVHEAYLRLVDQSRFDWKGRAHFLGVAANTIRLILVDHARKVNAEKRGGDRQRTALHDSLAAEEGRNEVDLLALEDALQKLASLHPRQARVVELRYFGGLSLEETAVVIGVAQSTVAADWVVAKAWLSRELSA
ncbi:MAG: sigma-70 family RNA polymerase sigma factor [Phycisphaerae bacterium]|jgi:RNA polymerase sigma-70 factor (ECF subfamily)|nr:sigma-70 family RNA polymerase sigma factor [Phycisphaerae bacterium]